MSRPLSFTLRAAQPAERYDAKNEASFRREVALLLAQLPGALDGRYALGGGFIVGQNLRTTDDVSFGAVRTTGLWLVEGAGATRGRMYFDANGSGLLNETGGWAVCTSRTGNRMGYGTIPHATAAHNFYGDIVMGGSRIYVAGPSAELSFADRAYGGERDDTTLAGQRWAWYANSTGANLWTPATSNVLTVASSGRLGVMNGSPQYPLDVTGDARASGKLITGNLAGAQYGTYFSAGVESGNGGLQGYVVPPPIASMALITVQGDRCAGAAGAHNGYWFGMWQQGSNRIFQIAAMDSTLGGAAQGFVVTWDGTAIRVVNKSGMSYNQSGRVTVQFFGS